MRVYVTATDSPGVRYLTHVWGVSIFTRPETGLKGRVIIRGWVLVNERPTRAEYSIVGSHAQAKAWLASGTATLFFRSGVGPQHVATPERAEKFVAGQRQARVAAVHDAQISALEERIEELQARMRVISAEIDRAEWRVYREKQAAHG